MRFAKNTFSILIRDIILFFSSIITSIFLARILGPMALGLWVAINLIPTYAETFGRVKTDAASVYYLGKGEFDIGSVSKALNWIAIISSLIIILPILMFYDQLMLILLKEKSDEYFNLGYIILLQIPINFMYLNYMYLHIYREDVRSLNIMILTRAILSSLLILTSLYILDLGLFGAAISSNIGILFAMIIGISRLGKLNYAKNENGIIIYKKLIKYGSKLYFGNIFSHFSVYAGQLMVVFFLLPAQVAFYSMAQQLGSLIEKISSALGTFLFPRLTKENSLKDASTFASQAFRTLSLIIIPIAAFIMMIIKPAVTLLYGKEFEPLVGVFYIIFPGISIMAIASTLTLFFQATGRADLLPKVLIFPIFLQIALGYYYIPELGVSVAAYGFSLSLILSSICYVILFLKMNNLSFVEAFFIRKTDFEIIYKFLSSIFYSLTKVFGFKKR